MRGDVAKKIDSIFLDPFIAFLYLFLLLAVCHFEVLCNPHYKNNSAAICKRILQKM